MNNNNNTSIIPILSYSNANNLKGKILETNKRINNSLKNRWLKILPIRVINIGINTIDYFPNNLEAAKHLEISISTLSRHKSEGGIFNN